VLKKRTRFYAFCKRGKPSFEKAGSVLSDLEKTAFVFVVTPERLSVFETERALKYLESSGIKAAGIVINGVIPQELSGDFIDKRKEVQEKVR